MKLLLTIAVVALTSFTLNAADAAGTWKASMETQMGTMDVTITIQSAATLAGQVKAGDYQGAIENGKVDGDKISFEATIEPGKLAFEGTLAGDDMKLNMTGTQGTRYLLAFRRQK